MITLNDLGYGVEIRDGDKSCFLQGDDADIVRKVEDDLCRIWGRRFGRGYRRKFGPFNSYEEHLTACLGEYLA